MKQIIIILSILVSSLVFSQENNKYNLKNNVAIQGYDPVAYFTENKAIKGSTSISFNEKGVLYYFFSKTNLELFKKNPEKFRPQYGGWCAYAMGINGERVKINPQTFKIINDKLYLFFNNKITNTLKLWNKDEKKLLSNADKYWTDYIKK